MLLSERSAALCTNSQTAILLSRKTKGEHRDVLRRCQHVWSETEATRRQSLIERKLRGGGLPRTSVPIVRGGPGRGGICDGCETSLSPRQLVMAVPNGDPPFVYLHADCFMIWNAARLYTRAA